MRDLSNATLAVIYAQESNDPELHLLTITSSEWGTTYRFVDDKRGTNLTSRGDSFVPRAFDFPIVGDEEGVLPKVEMVIDDVPQTMIAALRTITSPISVTLEAVLASAPDTLIAGPWDFELREVRWNRSTIRGSLQYEPLLDEPYPVGRFTPTDFPNLFSAVED